MPNITSIGTYLPCWGVVDHRVAGDDEDAITLAVEAGRAALSGGASVDSVVLVSRDLPLTDSSNAAVLLAGLDLDPELEVTERLGGAPATLDALSSARSRTLVIGVDLEPAGAAAVLTADRGLNVRTSARVARSLPVRTRNTTGAVHDYGDPRLLHDRGLVASLAASWLDKPTVVAGVDRKAAARLAEVDAEVPTMGASSGLFALAAMAEQELSGSLVAVEQASLSGISVAAAPVAVYRRDLAPRSKSEEPVASDDELRISLAAYERAFEAKVRWEAGKFTDSEVLDFPPRYHVGTDGALRTDYELVPLPRAGVVYSEATVHVPVPGLPSPYSLVLVELDDVGVRALVKVAGAHVGLVGIGDRGRLVLRRLAIRSGVPDYGYAFEPEEVAA
ncbi:OB-fold domain-containing protein [Gordonia sp. SL306]|uniref:OB-fold domain-containing protein n=1 Tax=Gordonia sp. SL306 TaxID=2995145 RepID=UPI002271B39C|nr:OB-fold domain-containing protein [Gordonia sp. SL306]WAC54174.1 OB-fold domain-containing protein [Gordonia sp. SL306]